MLSKLLDDQVFHILPDSALRPQNPATLPRGFFIQDDMDPALVLGQHTAGAQTSEAATRPLAKKKGRPSKRDKSKKTKDAIAGLDRWLEKNTFTYPVPPTAESEEVPAAKTTHTLIAHPPVMTHSNYAMQKAELLEHLTSPAILGDLSTEAGGSGQGQASGALARANEAMLTRLKRIDEMAAEKGLEVGGEGGDMTGLSRVERAVAEMREGRSTGGIMNLLEGAGFRQESDGDNSLA